MMLPECFLLFTSACCAPPSPATGVSNESWASSLFFLIPTARSQLPVLLDHSLLRKPYQPHSHLRPHLPNAQA